MKLRKLSANNKNFKEIIFKPKGLSLIVGGTNHNGEDRANGVGKTWALRIVNYCLGANTDNKIKKLAKEIPDWEFYLEVEIDKEIHRIDRRLKDGKIALDEKQISREDLLNWFLKKEIFELPKISTNIISFRTLIRRFMRVERKDCIDPIMLAHDKPHTALINNLWLLGFDVILAEKKVRAKERIDHIKKLIKEWNTNPQIKEILSQTSNLKAQKNALEEEIKALEQSLEHMNINEEYYKLVEKADLLTKKIRDIEINIEKKKMRLSKLEELLEQTPDISVDEIRNLYSFIGNVFKPEILRHFKHVENFHKNLYNQRKERLADDIAKLKEDLSSLEKDRQKVGKERDSLLQRLQGTTSFEEYQSVVNELSRKKERLETLKRYLDFSKELENEKISLQQELADTVKKAFEYLEQKKTRVDFLDKKFREFAKILFKQISAGLTININNRTNKTLYDIVVTIEGSSSEGINDGRILCYDWLIYNFGDKHQLDFLWHDNRLFAHLEPQARAKWFKNVILTLKDQDKQYIASLNLENLNAMKDYLNKNESDEINDSVILRLNANNPRNKLFGFQFNI